MLSFLPKTLNLNDVVVITIISSVVLAFILVVIIFSIRYKIQSDRIIDLKRVIKAKDEKISSLENSLSEIKKINSTQKEYISNFKNIENGYIKECNRLESELKVARSEILSLNKTIDDLRDIKKSLENILFQTENDLNKTREEVEKAEKRKDFWVEQCSELGKKCDALKLQLKKYIKKEKSGA